MATNLPDKIKEIDRTSSLSKVGNKDVTDEMRQRNINAAIVLKAKKTLEIPFIVLTAELNDTPGWRDSQIAFKTWSTLGKQYIVTKADHYIHNFQPDVVVNEILSMANE